MAGMKPGLVIWGASGHGKVVADAARAGGVFAIAGFIDDDPALHGGSLLGLPILGGPQQLSGLKERGVTYAFIAVGRCATRMALGARALAAGLELATIIHPRATVAGDVLAEMGGGTLIAAGAVVNPGCRLGAHVIINTLAGVDHDCQLADGVHIAPGSHLAGGVTVGQGALVGVGAVVREGLRLGARCTIGAGAAVVTDVPEGVTVVGVPARPLVHRSE